MSTGYWGHKLCAFSRVQSSTLGTQTPATLYGVGEVTQKKMQKGKATDQGLLGTEVKV